MAHTVLHVAYYPFTNLSLSSDICSFLLGFGLVVGILNALFCKIN